MQQLELKTEISEGMDIEVRLLFAGARRKIVQITLRRDAVLKAHQAEEPITVQCITGTGDFVDVANDKVQPLAPGTLITLDPTIVHEVRALPEVSILLTKFLAD